tara:strand:+ start:398 stop:595 length:198 start_codon:yes stop_codon:yes gene_type:complete
MDVSDEELKKFADIIFRKAFNLGCFYQDIDGKESAKRLLYTNIEDGCGTEKIREMLSKINIRELL